MLLSYLMINANLDSANGERWLYELCYGVEKYHRLEELGKGIRSKSLEEIAEWATGREVSKTASKLKASRYRLGKLIDTTVELIPLEPSEPTPDPQPSVNGKLKRLDLANSNLVVKSDLGLQTVQFAAVTYESGLGNQEIMQVEPLVKLLAELPYK